MRIIQVNEKYMIPVKVTMMPYQSLIIWTHKHYFCLLLQNPKSEAVDAIRKAIDAGFRHIDAAYAYQNEEEVGQAIRSKIADGTVKREDIFYTSKVWWLMCGVLIKEIG